MKAVDPAWARESAEVEEQLPEAHFRFVSRERANFASESQCSPWQRRPGLGRPGGAPVRLSSEGSGASRLEINGRDYWDWRFSSGDWEAKKGREQTASFARAQVERFDLPRSFSGTLLDFGCGLGDAMPVYRGAFPNATLLGIDISTAAIARCRADYGHLASFFVGDHRAVPRVSVVIASNVLEHITDDLGAISILLERCERLYIAVPCRERLQPGQEHLHAYDETSFQHWRPYAIESFVCPGGSQFGMRDLWWNVYAKNVVRPLFGRPIVRRTRQIMFSFGRGSRRS